MMALSLVLVVPAVASAETYTCSGNLCEDNRCGTVNEKFRLTLYEHADFTGNRIRICAAANNLNIMAFGWPLFNFNDTMTSYRWTQSDGQSDLICLYDRIDFDRTGSYIPVGPWSNYSTNGLAVDNVGSLWNDRVSSVKRSTSGYC